MRPRRSSTRSSSRGWSTTGCMSSPWRPCDRSTWSTSCSHSWRSSRRWMSAGSWWRQAWWTRAGPATAHSIAHSRRLRRPSTMTCRCQSPKIKSRMSHQSRWWRQRSPRSRSWESASPSLNQRSRPSPSTSIKKCWPQPRQSLRDKLDRNQPFWTKQTPGPTPTMRSQWPSRGRYRPVATTLRTWTPSSWFLKQTSAKRRCSESRMWPWRWHSSTWWP